jgi:hypothetical protein
MRETNMGNVIGKSLLAAIAAVAFVASSAAWGYANSVTYSGQGLVADGLRGFDLHTEICGVANGADVEGPYLLWS